MYVTGLILDGFKSYAHRTVINGWDPQFNSITGLNGSGKSNILDAICFVLGITKMDTVRAENLNDLIYKKGQAGTTKASVTIIFDNRDKSKSPISHKNLDEVTIQRSIALNGTSKYQVNGYRVQQDNVHRLFQEVGLNINNPNFLIMQGKITKVLNMKAVEIMGLLEEAAGTRMYEDRKGKAIRAMAKKQLKVDELEQLLAEEIDPKLTKLRQERSAFMAFQNTQSELERLERLVVAYDYVRYKERLQQTGGELEAKRERVRELEDGAVRMKKEIEYSQDMIAKVKADREKELRKGGKFQALEEAVKSHSHEIVRLTTALDMRKNSMAEESQDKTNIENSITELQEQLSQKEEAFKQLEERFETARKDLAEQTQEVEKKEDLLQTLQTGVASKEGQESGYQGQLQDARDKASAAATEQEQKKLQISHFEKQIKEDEPKAKKAKQENSGLLQELDRLRAEAQKLETELTKMGFEPGRAEGMYQEEKRLQTQIQELRRRADGLRRGVANINFDYSDPSPGFDRSRVKGLVAQLFTLKKEHSRAGTALEICAGGRLYNVVVDDADTASQILQKGKLKKRVTIIPLNKIDAFQLAAQRVGAAQRIAPGKVDLALSLIGYDDEVTRAMQYVFGGTLVCNDADTAKQVTFDAAVKAQSVTLEGDVYNPGGTLSGGSAPRSNGMLLTLQKLNEVMKELKEAETHLATLQATMAREKKKLDSARQIQQTLEIKGHEIKLKEDQISGNSSSSIIQRLEEMKNTIVTLKEEIKEATAKQDDASKDIKRIERDMNEFNSNKGGKLKELQSSLEKLKKALAKNNAAIKPLQAEKRDAELDLGQCKNDLESAQERLRETHQSLSEKQQELDDLVAEQDRAQEAHDIAHAKLSDEQAKLTTFDNELRDLDATIQSKKSQIAEEDLQQKKLAHEIDKFHKETETAASSMQALEKQYDWIATDCERFGRPNTPYDFKGSNMGDLKARRKHLQEQFQGQKKKINPKVTAMLDSVEKKEASVKRNLQTVIKDKKAILDTIEKLDRYKRDALDKTWRKVDVDFGNIFADVLPGSFAKLVPPEGKTIHDGLEVKVQLGKVWKQSLTELSGGQRSLIALSLIMALLQYKPAPMYILDEVDAALDVSHTENIGHLIRTRFKGSQFIVVSLKNDMFKSANRVFRTRFINGASVVEATTAARI